MSSDPTPDHDPRPVEADPVTRLLTLVDDLETTQRQMLDVWGEITDWGGLPGATGWTGDEWLLMVARLPDWAGPQAAADHAACVCRSCVAGRVP